MQLYLLATLTAPIWSEDDFEQNMRQLQSEVDPTLNTLFEHLAKLFEHINPVDQEKHEEIKQLLEQMSKAYSSKQK